MLDRDNAHRVDTRRNPSGSTYKTFYFYCREEGCGLEISSQISHLKKHSGLCTKHSQKGEPYNHIITELKKSCSRKNRECTITLEEFKTLIEVPECTYCKVPLNFNKHTRDENSKPLSRASQLDRKNNDLGYTLDNVVLCCWDCNRLKSNRFTYEEFLLLGKVMTEIMLKRKQNNTNERT